MLGFYKYKVDNNMCTMDEMNSAARVLQENLDISGSIKDFSTFYGVPENQVRSTISRKLIAKPIRVLLYPFHKFLRIVPDSWRKK